MGLSPRRKDDTGRTSLQLVLQFYNKYTRLLPNMLLLITRPKQGKH